MSFQSILHEGSAAPAAEEARQPEFFSDLHLDQIVAAITKGRDEYRLEPFFNLPLQSAAAIGYRQEVFRDLESGAVAGHVQSFAEKMRSMREYLSYAAKAHYPLQQQRWFLEAVDAYCVGVGCLSRDLTLSSLHSQGLRGLQRHLAGYTQSEPFKLLVAEIQKLKEDLTAIRYRLHIDGACIHVSRYQPEPDYGEEVAKTFEKFRQGATAGHEFEFPAWLEMNHVEAAILDRVALLFPQVFAALDEFCSRHRGYLDGPVSLFDREVQFYLATLEYLDRFRAVGLACCYPVIDDGAKEMDCRDVFDLSLADKLRGNAPRLVRNDCFLKTPERILVVSGANQGGKTTFARIVGQLHYLGSLGCPVGANAARLFLPDRIFTHFEREENLQTLRSKLEDDLVRIHGTLQQATPRSLMIMNESFSSATWQDALLLGRQVLARVIELDLPCVFVTFLDELASLGETTVSMVSTMKPGNSSERSFKILRMPADGLAYAAALADKYKLRYEDVRTRIAS